MNKIRMILADDETVILKGIQKLVDWNALGIEIAGVFEDGRSAFEGIVRLKPDIALLDISMPKMTGIDILKEIHSMEIGTNIIFISGFQDFNYAKSAVKYGAVDYLLKPVIREELMAAIEKCVFSKRPAAETTEEKTNKLDTDLSSLIELEETNYVPVLCAISYPKECQEQMVQLIKFSFQCAINNFLDRNGLGISFERNNNIIAIIKGKTEREVFQLLTELRKKTIDEVKQTTLFIAGSSVENMSDIPAAFNECLKNKSYLFFADQIPEGVLTLSLKNDHIVDIKRLENMRQEMVNQLMSKNIEGFDNYFVQFKKMVYRISEGKKEDACFHFCTTAVIIEEKLNTYNANEKSKELKSWLDIARGCISYEELSQIFYEIFLKAMDSIESIAKQSDKQSFKQALDYIEQHFSENLSLNILADVTHMNPYYFSSFFKKNAGMNYKEYVNKVRIENAIPLLISTDKKTYEIAVEVGFSDARTFSEAFQKFYNETPNVYRKRIRG